MMVNTIFGLTDYYSVFASPVQSYQVNPVTNLIYEATANKIFSQTVGKKLQSSTSSYLSSLNSSTNNLKSAVKPFTLKAADSLFDRKSVTASDSTTVSGTTAANADVSSYTLNITKLAVAQTNMGLQMNSGEKSFNTGINSFSIKTGTGQAKNIYVNINENDTNKTGLEKIASAINYAQIGVNANVVNDSKTGTSYLKLTASRTGTDNAFTLSDIAGNAVSASSTATVSAQAQNADYSIDGNKYTSQENTVSLNNGKVKLTLNKADSKDIKLQIGTDTNGIIVSINNLVESYNKLSNFSSMNSSSFNGAKTLSAELGNIVNSRKASLYSIGISVRNDDSLVIDGKKLDQAINTDIYRVKDVLSGSFGIAEKLYNKANEILTAPVKYSKPVVQAQDSTGVTWYAASAASRMPASWNFHSGMVVDMLL